MSLRSLVWNVHEGRPRAPVRLVVGVVLIAVLAVVGTVAAELIAVLVWPARPEAYVLVGSTLGLAAGALVGVVLVARYLDRRPLADYGVRGGRGWWRDVAAGVVLAVGVQAAVLGVHLAAGWATVVGTVAAGPEGIGLALLATVVLFAVVAVYEELVARGVVLTNVAEGLARYGPRPAAAVGVAISSGLFGVVHLLNPGASAVSTLGIALIGVTFGASYVLTGRLGVAVGLHFAWNVAAGTLFGFPVSGQSVPARLLVVDVTGPVAWTGGAFGPEAGLLGVLAALAGLAGVVAYARLVEGRLRVHPDLLVPTGRGRPTGVGTADPAVGADRPSDDGPPGGDVDRTPADVRR
jgi:membrane protease YdiL (CAAX protease family)